MRSFSISTWQLVGLVAAVSLPFFNFARYIPSPDWWSNASAVGLLLYVLVLGVFRQPGPVEIIEKWPRAWLWLLLWWLMVFLPPFLLRSDNIYQLPLTEAGGVLIASMAALQVHYIKQALGRETVVATLAVFLLLAALLQSLIGFTQLLGLAPLAHGYLVFDPQNPIGSIVGNVGQRNQFAQLLTWGILAAAYLWSADKLRAWLAVSVMLVLSVVIAWSGGRLPIAYALAMLVVGAVWYCRTRDRMVVIPLMLAAICIASGQLLGKDLAYWLAGVDLSSGLDRLGEAGFGARRRIEWQKAWQIVHFSPWLGVGISGFAYQSAWLETFAGLVKVPETGLFTHSHNLVTQLLAETGVPATLLALTGMFFCLAAYWRRDQATKENAFLAMLALVILGHSMFEYPLWYMPFLTMFLILLMLAPQAGVVIPVRLSLRKLGLLLLLPVMFYYVMSGAQAFAMLSSHQIPPRDSKLSQRYVAELLALAPNPFWAYEAEMALGNYLQPSRDNLQLKLRHYEQLVAYRPYPMLLCHLAMLRQWSGNVSGARDAMLMALANYPNQSSQLVWRLELAQDSALQPLLELARTAAAAQARGGDLAAVEAITKGLPVRGPQIPDLSRFR